MSLQAVWDLAQSHRFLAFVIGILLVMSVAFLISKLQFNASYLFVLAVATLIAFVVGLPIYIGPFVLGMTTAFAEIINKFDDEPMKALKSPPALCYHVLNGLIAVFALYLLALVAGKPANLAGLSDLDKVKYVTVAGLGAMLIMRSKLFNIKVGDENVSFGPEQIITTLFRFMESAIGRFRARARREFIEEALDNIKFDAVYERSVMTLKRASRKADDDAMTKCIEELKAIKTCLDGVDTKKRTDADIQLKSYEMGYIIYDRMGEDFVSDLFSQKRPEWLIRPPDEEVKNTGVLPVWKAVETDNIFVKAMPFVGTKDVVPYMAYGTNMSSNRIRQRLNWLDSAGKESLEKTKPVACRLANYRLAFNRISESKPNQEGLANLEPMTGENVEGVLYQLPKTAMDFLENNEPGYHRLKVRVAVTEKKPDGTTGETTETDAWAFVADTDCVDGEQVPVKTELASMIEGAVEHGLSQEYRDKLARYETELTRTESSAAVNAPGSMSSTVN